MECSLFMDEEEMKIEQEYEYLHKDISKFNGIKKQMQE